MKKSILAALAVVFMLLAAPAGAEEKALDAASIDRKIITLLEDTDTLERHSDTAMAMVAIHAAAAQRATDYPTWEKAMWEVVAWMNALNSAAVLTSTTREFLAVHVRIYSDIGGEMSPEAAAVRDNFLTMVDEFGRGYNDAAAIFKIAAAAKPAK